MDLGIEVILELFTKEKLQEVFEKANEDATVHSMNAQRIYALKEEYLQKIDQVVSFLQGHDQNFARQICSPGYLPQAARFDQLDDLEWAFGSMGMQDKAKHLATLFLEDISDFLIECIDSHFGFSRYAERLGMSANSFDELYDSLSHETTYIDLLTISILEERMKEINPKMVCISIPFPGNLYSAFRCAQYIKTFNPEVKVSMGGGFPNTELRDLKDKRVFEFFDFITLDDGELPIELLYQHVMHPTQREFKRTFLFENDEVVYQNSTNKRDYRQSEVGTPDYSDLLLDKYISVIELANPMHSLWSDGRWNKLTMAHGCYWGKCTFCDISLDYIKIYEPVTAKLLVDRMEEIITQTNESGFHFVDEAAPPALMRELALEILRRGLITTWWTNIRFEKNFSADLCRLLKMSGCIAVSGGLEVASDRLLALIDKGVTVEQVANVVANFTDAGIMVHSYLMYGYPTQTVEETIDSLEMVRQMFELGILQSGFWHQFALTAHSPVGMDPASYGVIPDYQEISFANNDIQFKDTTGINHDQFSYGLKKSLFNYMHGICFDVPLQDWFDFEIPIPNVAPDFIENALEFNNVSMTKSSAKIIWMGKMPIATEFTTKKKKKAREMLKLSFHTNLDDVEISFDKRVGQWLLELMETISLSNNQILTFDKIKADYENHFDDFEPFWYSKEVTKLKEVGLLSL